MHVCGITVCGRARATKIVQLTVNGCIAPGVAATAFRCICSSDCQKNASELGVLDRQLR